MKQHTTNYADTFLVIADDCPLTSAEPPPVKADKQTIATIQFDLIKKNPYKYTSDDVIFQVFADKNDLTKSEYKEARESFFSKGQPCMRTSPLTKRYGWGVHFDKEGKMAIFGVGSAEYNRLSKEKSLKIVKAMKSSR